MAKDKRRGVSLRPEDAVDAGLWMGGDAVIEEALFTEYDYGGTVRRRVLPIVLLVTYRHAEGTYEQPYGVGEGWEVDKNGDILIPTRGQKGLSKSCNALAFFKSLEDADYDLAELDESVHALEGQGVVCSRQAQPERDIDNRRDDRRRGLDRDRDDDRGRKKDDRKSYILIDALLDEAPKFGKSGKGAAKSKKRDDDEEDEKPKSRRGRDEDDEDEQPTSRSRSTSRDEDDEDEKPARGKTKRGRGEDDDADEDDNALDEEAEDALVEVLEKAKGQTLKASAVEEAVYAHLKGHPKRKQVAERAADEDFQKTLRKTLTADGKTVTLK